MDAKKLAQSINDTTDIVKVVEQHLALKRVGKNHRGLCPFHSERTPSFYVHPSNKRFFCYGCKEGGDAIRFVEKIRGVNFIEACEILISDFSLPIEIKKISKRSGPSKKQLDTLLRVQDFAARFYASRLSTVNAACDYLKQERHIDDLTVKHFQLGASTWKTRDSFYMALRKKVQNHSQADDYFKAAEQTGLWLRRGNQPEDRFLERIMIPIRDLRGRIVGFGSRTLSDRKDIPKYLNSPESELFQKRKQLYGFFENADAIRKAKELYLVEGFFDVIKLWQHGIQNVCASMGTSLSEAWIKRLKKYLKRLIIVFDGDEAGLQAMVRHAPDFFKLGWEPDVMVLPEGLDPDSFVDQKGVDAFIELSKESKKYFDFYFIHRLRETQHSYFELIALFDQLVSVLATSCPYPVALTRLENYLNIADLGAETRDAYLRKLRRHVQGKAQKPASGGFHVQQPRTPQPWIRSRIDELRLVQLGIYDLAFIEEITQLTPKLLKDKVFCDVIRNLNEYKNVLETISNFDDRLQYLQYSQPGTQVSNMLFDALGQLDKTGLGELKANRQLFEQLKSRLKQRIVTKERKMKLMEFKQKYADGRMSWSEVLNSLEDMQDRTTKTPSDDQQIDG